jgi:hypothetical protein
MTIIDFISHTPWWVWAILVYVIFIGIKTLQTRVVFIPQLFLIPVILIALKYKIIFSELIFSYIGFLLLGILVGIYLAFKSRSVINKKESTVKIEGSSSTLILLLSFFGTKYLLVYLQETQTLSMNYAFVDTAISAALSGYFLGRAFYFLYKKMA